MRKIIILLVIFIMLAVLLVIAQETVKEEVKVVNVEVPVRVFYKGKPVDNLSIDDFKLYENKKQQSISSLNIVRRKIEVENKKPSYFVFLFRAYNYNEQFREGIRYIFENILMKEDTLMVLVNDDIVMIDRLNDKEAAFSRVEKLIIEQSQVDRRQLSSYLKRVEQEIDMRSFKFSLSQGNFISVQDFLKRYLRIWKDYKEKYLLPDLKRYYHFSKKLERIKKEKWVINFFQMEMLPTIIIPGEIKRSINRFTDNLMESPKAENVSYGRILRTILNEIEKETNIVLEFPVEEISKLFYKVDATFHTIFMRTTIGVESRDHESMKINSDMEKCIGDITRATGGMLVSTSNVRDAVDRIVEAENVYYILTYAPKNPGKAGKLKIKAGKKKYKVLYDDNIRADYIKEYFQKRTGKQERVPAIRIKSLAVKNKKLIITIDGFSVQKTEKDSIGKLGIHICIKNSNGKKVFDKGKLLTTQKDIVTIYIALSSLKNGKHEIIVDVKDFHTGKTDRKSIR